MEWIEMVKVILLGIIEGITEWLPISSTGHMILADEFIKLNTSEEFKNLFLVVIQLGAILAVVVLYFNKLNPFSKQKTKNQRSETISLWIKVVVACIPGGISWLLFNDMAETLLYNYQTVTIMLILYGVLFIIIEHFNKNRKPKIEKLSDLDFKTAILIGMFQILAIIPGTSRSGATIIGGMMLGVSRYIAAEFTFFLAIPVMFGASVLKILRFGFYFETNEIIILLTGMIVAFFVSIGAIKFLMGYIKKNDFRLFGYYRILLGIVVLAYFQFLA